MLRFAHLSDPHLEAEDNIAYKGVRPNRRFASALDQLARTAPLPAFALVTGDLVAEETPAHYAALKRIVERMPCEVHFALGNHDDPGLFRQAMGCGLGPEEGRHTYAIERDGLRVLVLDSHVTGEVSGTVGPAQLTWLDKQLARPGAEAAVVFVHHPPAAGGVAWLDDMRLTDGDALLERLAGSPLRVARVFCGHVHQSQSITVGALTITTVPSTGYQFTDGDVTPRVHAGTAGYHLITWDAGRLSSMVVPVAPPEADLRPADEDAFGSPRRAASGERAEAAAVAGPTSGSPEEGGRAASPRNR